MKYANPRSINACFSEKCPAYAIRKVVQHIWQSLVDKINRQQRANNSKDVVASHRRRSVEPCHHRFFNLIAIRNQSMQNDLHEARDRRWRKLLWIFLIFYSLSLSPMYIGIPFRRLVLAQLRRLVDLFFFCSAADNYYYYHFFSFLLLRGWMADDDFLSLFVCLFTTKKRKKEKKRVRVREIWSIERFLVRAIYRR